MLLIGQSKSIISLISISFKYTVSIPLKKTPSCVYRTHTSWKSAIIEGAVVVLCPVEVLSRRQTQHQHKHMAHTECTAGQHGIPEPAAQSLSGSSPVLHTDKNHSTSPLDYWNIIGPEHILGSKTCLKMSLWKTVIKQSRNIKCDGQQGVPRP